MRRLVISKRHFDTFLFPQIASSSAKDESEFETALRLLRKIKDPVLTEEVPLTKDEREAQNSGQVAYAFRRLIEPEAAFLLEEDEYALLKRRIGDHKTKVAILALDDFSDMLGVIEKAPDFKVEPKAAAE